MYNFKFTLDCKFSEATANSLYENGCDDALFYKDDVGVHLEFCRLGHYEIEAVKSAENNILNAGYKLINLEIYSNKLVCND